MIRDIAMTEKPRYERTLWGLTGFLVLIGMAIVVRRLIFLANLPPGPYVPVANSHNPVPDNGFAEHPLLTAIHIVPAIVFVLLAPLQFVKKIQVRYTTFRRITLNIVLACGLIIGSTALIMGFIMTIGGITETLAVAVYGTAFLYCTLRAWITFTQNNLAQHRQWMIRVLAIALAVSTTRPVVVLFFATSRLTGLTTHQYFGIAFWIAFTLHIIVAELWIRRTRTNQ
jgi:hypothetical protein